MTLGWPDDNDVRRVVATWGHLLDEALLAEGGAAGPGLDWPEDEVVAETLAQWGRSADRAVDEAAARQLELDPTMAWLGGAAYDEAASPPSQAGDADWPELAAAARVLTGREPFSHAHPRPVFTTAPVPSELTELVPAVARSRAATPAHRRGTQLQRWSQVAVVAAVAAAVVLIGGQSATRNRRSAQSLQVGVASTDRSGANPSGPSGNSVTGPAAPGSARPGASMAPGGGGPVAGGTGNVAGGTGLALGTGVGLGRSQGGGNPASQPSTATTLGSAPLATTAPAGGAVSTTSCRNPGTVAIAGTATGVSATTATTITAVAVAPRTTTTTRPGAGSPASKSGKGTNTTATTNPPPGASAALTGSSSACPSS